MKNPHATVPVLCDRSAGRRSHLLQFLQILSLGLAALWLPFQAQDAAAAESCDKPFELSSSGRYLVDACDNRFKLKSVNWFGGSDTWHVPLGLDKQPLAHIVGLIGQMGFNSVRLPFSNEAIHVTAAVNPAHVSANPELVGKTPLQVYDATVKA